MSDTVPPPAQVRVARWVSVLGHPFVLVPLTTLYAVGRKSGLSDAAGSAGAVAIATVVPVLALVAIGVRRAAWSDHDVSDRSQRRGFYKALLVVLPLGSAALWVLQPALRRGIVASWGLILASMAANRFVKSSLHVAFAAFCAASVPLPAAGAIAAGAAVIAIGWSRLALKRHTLLEVALGALIGTSAGLLLRFWP
jgi:membrane-associated phospholipid phosphatase